MIPIALGFVGVPEPELWGWSSAIMVVAVVPAHVVGVSWMRRNREEVLDVAPIRLLVFAATTILANLIAQVCNALGVGSLPMFGVYLIGLILYLLFAAIQFARMLFVRPSGS